MTDLFVLEGEHTLSLLGVSIFDDYLYAEGYYSPSDIPEQSLFFDVYGKGWRLTEALAAGPQVVGGLEGWRRDEPVVLEAVDENEK